MGMIVLMKENEVVVLVVLRGKVESQAKRTSSYQKKE